MKATYRAKKLESRSVFFLYLKISGKAKHLSRRIDLRTRVVGAHRELELSFWIFIGKRFVTITITSSVPKQVRIKHK